MSSEVAKIKQQITLECEAMKRALSGYAITAKHEFIHHKYEQLGHYQDQLSQLVGDQQAAEIATIIYIKSMEG
ncbi:hypothetical protein EPA93_09855 [Ktedonosporobacter rubrisoli]|uniref:Uncharacterized protein n=1 Tax=Ktedonosporobacter rubrisoli TaxID=2509675 RepID=A0A4P6JM39_KTERU|nr:hypothetical protein [Ktedonosporobacter rubrisoli]QBD76295.1 hypothetical protein EPA93_09855 [Ktedonosporobacter rubrisoli]